MKDKKEIKFQRWSDNENKIEPSENMFTWPNIKITALC